ncbi:DNA damage-binding protein [Gracilaria domingensis]|nr:DNA damage-binding protein [Gracilaria domingensis]
MATQIPAGDERTGLLLRRRYQSVGCYYCRDKNVSNRFGHTHTNCPLRPCFLCKQRGHTSLDCPHRTRPNAHTQTLSRILRNRERLAHLHHFTTEREASSSLDKFDVALPYVRNRQFDCELSFFGSRLHAKRVTTLEWHPSGRYLLSADKSGAVRVIALTHCLKEGAFDRKRVPKLHPDPSHVHHCNINNIVFDNNPDVCYTSSSDGKVSALRIPLLGGAPIQSDDDLIQAHETVVDLNPNGWQGSISLFKMVYGMASDTKRNCLYVGASDGTIRRFDPRQPADNIADIKSKFHASKVTCIDVNPINSDLVVTASNDARVCLWDARKFVETHPLGWYKHDRVVSSAYFSPNTGSKLLTTAMDNKLRVWQDIHSFQGSVNDHEDASPLEIVHSHDFHRYLTAFRAVWDPKDWTDDLFMCGRFLGDAYRDGEEGKTAILHPIDLFSVKAGSVVHSLMDLDVPLICTTNKFSPSCDVIATAASSHLIFWSPPLEDENEDHPVRRKKRRRLGTRDSDDDDGDGDEGGRGGSGAPGPKKKLNTIVAKSNRRSARLLAKS